MPSSRRERRVALFLLHPAPVAKAIRLGFIKSMDFYGVTIGQWGFGVLRKRPTMPGAGKSPEVAQRQSPPRIRQLAAGEVPGSNPGFGPSSAIPMPGTFRPTDWTPEKWGAR